MWSTPKPILDAEMVFRTCVARSRNRALLLAAAPEVATAAKCYETAAVAGETHLLAPSSFTSKTVSDEELQNVYMQRMVGKRSAGRAIYREIRDAIHDNICPMCGHRPVSSLDHALPKTHFPLLSVTPVNLVPCCSDCNHTKRESIASTPADGYLHPYFDDIDDDMWLIAEVLETSPAAAVFLVDAPDHWDSALTARVKNHFRSLRLANLYTAQAGTEIRALEPVMERAYARNQVEGVREELADHREGRRRIHQNTWQGALFHALLLSDWYCHGGFRASPKA